MHVYSYHLRKLPISMLLIFLLHVSSPSAHSNSISPASLYYKVKIGNYIYQVIDLDCGGKRRKAVIDLKGKMICDSRILEKTFYAGMLIGYNIEPENRIYRFWNFNQRILQYKNIFKQALQLIPLMEMLSAWAFDLGPRAVTEAALFAVTGGTSLSKLSLNISLNIIKNSISYISNNPRAWLVALHSKILQDSESRLDQLERKIAELKDKDILDYEEIKTVDDLYWISTSNGWAAIKIYQAISGELLDNLKHGFDAVQDELLALEAKKSGEPITWKMLTNQFGKVISVTKLGILLANEKQYWEKSRKEYMLFNEEHINEAANACKCFQENSPSELTKANITLNIDNYLGKLAEIERNQRAQQRSELKNGSGKPTEEKEEIYMSQFQGKQHPEEKEIVIIDKSENIAKNDFFDKIGDTFSGLANSLTSIAEYNKYLSGVTQKYGQLEKELQKRSASTSWQQISAPQNNININNPPYVSANLSPTNGSNFVLPRDVNGLEIRFQWEGGDQDPGDQVTYWLYLRENVADLSSGLVSGNAYWTGTAKNTTIRWYSPGTWYWKIIATDKNNLFAAGPIWSFVVQ